MRRQRHAKITATAGPASASLDKLRELFLAGVDTFRRCHPVPQPWHEPLGALHFGAGTVAVMPIESGMAVRFRHRGGGSAEKRHCGASVPVTIPGHVLVYPFWTLDASGPLHADRASQDILPPVRHRSHQPTGENAPSYPQPRPLRLRPILFWSGKPGHEVLRKVRT